MQHACSPAERNLDGAGRTRRRWPSAPADAPASGALPHDPTKPQSKRCYYHLHADRGNQGPDGFCLLCLSALRVSIVRGYLAQAHMTFFQVSAVSKLDVNTPRKPGARAGVGGQWVCCLLHQLQWGSPPSLLARGLWKCHRSLQADHKGPGMISGRLSIVHINAPNVFEGFDYCPVSCQNSEACSTEAVAPRTFGSCEMLCFHNVTAAHVHAS